MSAIKSFFANLSQAQAMLLAALITVAIGGMVTGYFQIRQIQIPIEATQTAKAELASEVLLAITSTATPVLPTNTRVLEGLKDTSTGEPIDTPTTTKVPNITFDR